MVWKRGSETGYTLVELVIVLLIVAFMFGNVFAWDYSVSFWLIYAEKPDNFNCWHGVLVSLIPGLGQLGLAAAGVTYIASFFV